MLFRSESDDPAERTRANVRDSDATLILTLGKADPGTEATLAAARELAKPHLIVDVRAADAAMAAAWFGRIGPRRLNVAGPRESHAPGLQEKAAAFLEDFLRHIAVDDDFDQSGR